MLSLNNYTHVLTGKQRQMKAVRRRTWEPCLLFSCSSHWAHYCHLFPCLIANFQQMNWGHHSQLLYRKLLWSIWALDHFCMPLHHSRVFTDKHLQVCKHSPTHYIITEERGVNILCSTKELSTNSERRREISKGTVHFLFVAFGFFHATHWTFAPSAKSRAKAWLLSALLTNEVRNLPLLPPGNWII